MERAASNNLGGTVGMNGWGWPACAAETGFYFGPLVMHPSQGINLPQFNPTDINGANPPIWQAGQGFHTGICIVGMGDGSVRTVSAAVGLNTWTAAVLPADGVPLGSDW
jgi:hypothetical protein